MKEEQLPQAELEEFSRHGIELEFRAGDESVQKPQDSGDKKNEGTTSSFTSMEDNMLPITNDTTNAPPATTNAQPTPTPAPAAAATPLPAIDMANWPSFTAGALQSIEAGVTNTKEKLNSIEYGMKGSAYLLDGIKKESEESARRLVEIADEGRRTTYTIDHISAQIKAQNTAGAALKRGLFTATCAFAGIVVGSAVVGLVSWIFSPTQALPAPPVAQALPVPLV